MHDEADLPLHHRDGPQIEALQRDISTLITRWQHAGVSLYEIAVVLTTAGCHTLGHAVGDVPPPEGPELLQQLVHRLQREAEACYFQHWHG
jgi:hypothetical protein